MAAYEENAAASVPPASGLVVHWAFDEGSGSTAFDSVGTNDGTLQNMDPATDWVTGQFGGALDFDGVNDGVRVSADPVLDITGNEITISLWLNGHAANPEGVVIEKGAWHLRVQDSSTSARFFLDTSSGATQHNVSFNWAPNTWYHFVGVYDGAQMRVYINNSEIGAPLAKTGTIDSSSTDLLIGNRGLNYFNGIIDDVRVYERALSVSEIGDLYNVGGPVAIQDYGVDVNLSTGDLSGYAWADSIGWISFEEAGPYPEAPNYAACLDRDSVSGENCDGAGDNTVSGWARAAAGDPAEGWDGWIKLTDVTWDSGTQELSGWAWGSDVVGWISFESVMLETNSAPSANNLDDAALSYCSMASPPIVLSWEFDDPDAGDTQSAHQVQVDDDPGFGSVDIDSGKAATASEQYAPAGLSYNTTYYWRVKVWDNFDKASAWVDAGSAFATEVHAWPNPSNFSWSPLFPDAGQVVQFEDGNSISGTPTNGPCGSPWCWDFGDGNTDDVEDPTHSFTPTQPYGVTLEACDDLGCCSETKTLYMTPPIPGWREISPFDNAPI